MTATAPEEIFKHCLSCRRETVHLRVAGLARVLYACAQACGAPAREVTAPEESTPAARRARELEEEAYRKREAYNDMQSQIKRAERRKYMPKPAAANPLIAAINRQIDARFAAFKAELGEAIAAKFTELLGEGAPAKGRAKIPAGFKCPRGVHKGPHGKKCLGAA